MLTCEKKSNFNWTKFIKEEFEKDYAIHLKKSITKKLFFPDSNNVLRVFKTKEIKVVIVGQDPYHNGQACGLAFSVENGPIPHSLKNILKEVNNDIGICKTDGNLKKWAEQGVFLINSILTVEKGKPLSHKNLGWEIFTDKTLELLYLNKNPKVFMLWGNLAKNKISLFKEKRNHLILTAAHPSPFSCKGFFGSNHFSKANIFLKNNNLKPIDWSL